ncbi:inner centromere protein A isoform X1 [Synchiropus splendidus]|uniref:inner centromere protein A isoform X1 n=1 Tax=Synchiropus splendidus TaxID=270530 RepID=UPI00237EDA59|nr:inner centromere protein A isoform X1 [Synchiropus splendidus]XP_053740947.1 inner centromere protein A isoform X1 [Synchiropus splendidus]XP_053740948.1 inner centromere protein A isoform X1 [Synchiropus splendidus]XP_053740949.1 inner centromere protein A isoform X1 [Synchiropus splendidus]
MYNIKSSLQSLTQMFIGKTTEYLNDIDNVHMVWLEEIEEEAHRIFSKDFNSEPELMPKTPSQKKNSRRKRVSLGRQEEQNKRRSSKGKRVNLRSSGIKSLNVVAEEESTTESPAPQVSDTSQPKRTTRQNMKASPDVEEATQSLPKICDTKEVSNKKPELQPEPDVVVDNERQDEASSSAVNTQSPKLVVRISAGDRLSAEFAKNGSAGGSPGRTATKIAIADTAESSQRRSVRHSLKLRHSLGGWRPSMTQESVRRASRRSIMKRKAAQADNSTCSGNVNGDSSMEIVEEDVVEIITPPTADTVDAVAQVTDSPPETDQEARTSVGRVTRSVAATLPALASAPLSVMCTPNKKAVATATHQPTTNRMSRRSTKRKAPDTAEESPEKQFTPPKKSQSAVRPNMRSFLHTVQKNQMLMMTPNTLGRSAVIKSFIKHTTPLKTDPKLKLDVVTKERMKLEALRKKQEQEEERMRKMEEEKRRKQEELRRKRDERLRRVNEAKVKEEQKEEEKKKKIEQKMAQIDDKRQAEEKAKKKVALKRQEELELKRKLEEEAKRKKLIQAEEEKRQQELLAKKAEEEELAARKVAEARRALELRREQERERERQAALEKEQKEREKALVLQRELEKAAREKERREQEEKRRLEELQRLAAEEKAAKEREAAKLRELANEKAAAARMAALNVTVDIEPPNASTPVGKGMAMNVTVDIEPPAQSTPVGKGTALNVTVDIEQSPQSYSLTPTNGKKAVKVSESVEDYGMDQNSDDSTDDESAPRKPVPSWAKGHGLQQILMKQYFNPPDFEAFFGSIDPPKLEEIFSKSKPRYFKRTSSAVWHSPPAGKN